MKMSTRSVKTRHSMTVFGDEGLCACSGIVRQQTRQGLKTFLLADRNTEKHCLPVLLDKMDGWTPDHLLVMEASESAKTLESASTLWQELALNGADRHSLLLNLGGGVITDLGGFVASCFKRGIRFINIPTTLMGMADAATGGKTGVNLQNLKNQVGTFSLPEIVAIHPVFLGTLAPVQLRSGLAEVIKCALIADERLWRWLRSREIEEMVRTPADHPSWLKMIRAATIAKNRFVRMDLEDRQERKMLNFGHTFGHAVESLMIQKKILLPHGDAVAMGMICESWLSMKVFGLDVAHCMAITDWLLRGFGKIELNQDETAAMTGLMLHDKKNIGGRIRFTGIIGPGAGKINGEASPDLVRQALQFYLESTVR